MMDDIGTLAELLDETAEHHDGFQRAAPPHDSGAGTRRTWTFVSGVAPEKRPSRPPGATSQTLSIVMSPA